jgi:hypothetical protein
MRLFPDFEAGCRCFVAPIQEINASNPESEDLFIVSLKRIEEEGTQIFDGHIVRTGFNLVVAVRVIYPISPNRDHPTEIPLSTCFLASRILLCSVVNLLI